MVAGSYEAGESLSGMARRYALSPQQLFACRYAARKAVADAAPSESIFTPALVDVPTPEPAVKHLSRPRRK